ncbi:MAG: carboxypeptidase-like regulatory domain-containing protein, partial [Chitinophagaceae bacterium]|nr:carboxypeptidase-like regulatory domain-containing protein [Chitinophagaceae bacterium]
YIKAIQEDSRAVKKSRNFRIDTSHFKNIDADLAGMTMTEVFLHLDYESDRRMKEERLGVKKSGNPAGLFYLTTTDGSFNFYNNLVKVPAISPTPFLSPISYSGLMAYKFKTIKTQRTGAHKIYTISVKPRELSNATVEGEVTISDSAWVILHTHFRFPEYHLPEYDFFEVDQHYSLIDNQAWLITRQQFTYYSKAGKEKLSGQTLAIFNNYELNKHFDKKHFGNEMSVVAQAAYEKDSSFWQTVRSEPLTAREIRFVRFKDSLYHVTHSKAYLDSIDKLINTITWKKIAFLGQTFYNRIKQTTWNLPPITSLVQPFSFGGFRISPSIFYSKIYPDKKSISLYTNLSYGIRNRDINGSVRITRLYNPFNRGYYKFSIGRDFQYIYKGDAWINLIKRSNVYLNNHLSFGHGLEVANGLVVYTGAEFALRRSVSNYKTNTKIDSVLKTVLNNNNAVYFDPYNAFYGKLQLSYTPKQRYIREPKEKVILGSKWPTFFGLWRKGLPEFLDSKVDFDYLEFGMEQEINVGLMGTSRYKIKTGNFFNTKDLRLIDYQFQRRGDPYLFMNPDEAFQALDSTFPLFKRFYQGHFVHDFNGFFLNRIPFFKKLELREVGGAGFLAAPERSLNYVEGFAGVERVFKWPLNPLAKFKLGVYVVGSMANKFSNPVQFKVGLTTWDFLENKWR